MVKANEVIYKVAKRLSQVVPACCAVTLGGSRAHELEDSISDVEMYFYSLSGVPEINELNDCLASLEAEHKRTNEFFWNQEPWGPHSFFVVEGLYFEVGYRIIGNIYQKLQTYQDGKVEPLPDCHDLGQGYMLSGLAASVASEKIIIDYNGEIKKLKEFSKTFSPVLKNALKAEYMETAKSLLHGKLFNAAIRKDVFSYEAIAARISRALFVMAFALSEEHFPGDKWNEDLLMRGAWGHAKTFLGYMRAHFLWKDIGDCNLIQRREYLVEAYDLIKMEVDNGTSI